KGHRVQIVGNLKVTAKEPKFPPQIEVSEIKLAGKVAPGENPYAAWDNPYSADYKVEGEVVVRARLKKGDPELKSDATLATDITLAHKGGQMIPIFFERKPDELHASNAGNRHQAVLGEAKKELAKQAAALQDRDVLVRASLQGHRFLTRGECIAYII